MKIEHTKTAVAQRRSLAEEQRRSLAEEQWRSLAEKTLKGKSIEQALATPVPEGLVLQPLYTDGPDTGVSALIGSGGWDIRQVFSHPDITACNREIIADLEGGVTSVVIRVDEAGRLGYDADHPNVEGLAGRGGVMIATADDLDTVLAGVDLDIVPVVLDAGAGGVALAAMLGEVWKKRGAFAQGGFNLDPLRTVAESGWLPGGLDQALADMASVAQRTAREYKGVTSVGVDTSPLYAAGADEALDLGAMLATAVAYLRALTDAGMGIDEAARQIAVTLAIGSDQFLAMAKLRAARLLWARVLEASGAEERRMSLTATVSSRVISQRDPWVNLLRVTLAVFSAAVAGADSIIAVPFDSAVGLSTAQARRLARNSQIILAEEAHLARVSDPASGSYALESLTHQLAMRGWEEFQAIERDGGMAAVVLSGALRRRLEQAWGERQKDLSHRKTPVLGVSEFPNLAEAPIAVEQPDLASLRRGAVARLKRVRREASVTSLEDVFSHAGVASVGVLSSPRGAEPLAIPPIKPHRLAEDFEALRDDSDVALVLTGERPLVFLLALGPLAEHSARLAFARTLFEAGGIETVTASGGDADAAIRAFSASGAALVCLCGADSRYESEAEALAKAFKAAGARRVYGAGKPSAATPSIDDYVTAGGNAVALLHAAHHLLGVA